MSYVLRFLCDFAILFIIFFIIYRVFMFKRKKDYSKLKKHDEIKLFIARYNLDMRKTKYTTVLNVVAGINSFIISFTAALILNIKNMVLKVVVCFVVVFILVYAVQEVMGRFLKKMEEKKNV